MPARILRDLQRKRVTTRMVEGEMAAVLMKIRSAVHTECTANLESILT